MSLRRPLATAALLTLALTGLVACGDDNGDGGGAASGGGDNTPLTIATQNFPEANLVGSLYDVLLSAKGYDVDLKAVDTRDAYLSTFPGDVDVVPEYLGAFGEALNAAANGEGAAPVATNDSEATLAAVEPLAKDKGITLLDLSEANSQNAFFVTQEQADGGLSTLSDLTGQSVVLAGSPDCKGRSDCEGGLTGTYGIDISEILPLGFASPETYAAVKDGEAQLGLTGTIDPNLDDEGLVLLDDDKGIQPAQNYVPAVSSEFLAAHGDIEQPLNDLMAALDNDTVNELLGRVTLDREKPEDVARDFLESEGLI
ncbi:glycine betaine ABC transporter substrate-binding protein [Nocardioides rubriscoriae]|uniref:glycine betaine ABC transporter substrate-binding protein n=1 Tax=Nocardioides rubriscoriae TaxID=642762 RepID=UPI0011DF03DA|nr:glycine betaine ABC transporter substrate-binding protein [Nocardioides rubriscoriae]